MAKKKKVISGDGNDYKMHDSDTGSVQYQIYLISKKIEMLQGHLSNNHKDHDAKVRLLKLVARRRTFLKYLKKNTLDTYNDISQKVGVKV